MGTARALLVLGALAGLADIGCPSAAADEPVPPGHAGTIFVPRPPGPGLRDEQVLEVRDQNAASLRRCWYIAGAATTRRHVHVTVTVTINDSGRVGRVRATARGVLGDSSYDVEECVETAVRSWVFPTCSEPTQTSFYLGTRTRPGRRFL